jgi:hypothetical protein
MPHKSEHIYNPIRDGAKVERKDYMDQKAVDLANEVRQIIKDYMKFSF